MPYTVLWRQSAEDALAKFWTEALDREAVSEAAAKIDKVLRDLDSIFAVDMAAIDTPEFIEIFLARPLAATFEVLVDDRIVWVLSLTAVPPYRKRPQA